MNTHPENNHPLNPRELSSESHGTTLFATESGSGRAVILLHGGLANHLAARMFAGPLASYRVITPDLRGAGRSVFCGRITWDLLADDVAALIDHLGLDAPVLGGTSFGSGVAIRTALRHPDRLGALLLLQPLFTGADTGLDAAPQAALERMHAAACQALTQGHVALHPLFAALPEPIRAGAIRMVDTFDLASVVATTTLMTSGTQPLMAVSELEAITLPTLVVPGTDPYHPEHVARAYRAHLGSCTYVESTPAELGQVIADFVDSLSGADATPVRR